MSSILRRLRSHPPPPPGTFRDPGVHTGNSAKLILHDGPGAGRAPVREGRCVRPFVLAPPCRWLAIKPRLPEGRYCTIRPLAVYTATPIILRQTADRPIAARHTEATYFRNSVLACVGIPGVDEACLLGLLNSTLVAFVHRELHADSRQRAFPQVKVAHLQALPIARDVADLQPLVERIERLAAERLGHQRQLVETLAAMLGCDPLRLAGSRRAHDLHQVPLATLLKVLGGQCPEARRCLRSAAAERSAGEAAAATRRAIAPLEEALCRERRRLDQLVYRIYAVRESEVACIEATAAHRNTAGRACSQIMRLPRPDPNDRPRRM